MNNKKSVSLQLSLQTVSGYCFFPETDKTLWNYTLYAPGAIYCRLYLSLEFS